MISLYKDDEQTINSCKKPTHFKRLVFGLNFFHSILWTRRHFGKLGWWGTYNWNNVDHSLVIEKLRQQLNASDEVNEDVPYKCLHYLTSQACLYHF